jgi:DNA-binding IclR family transcriptional regulator
MKMAINKRAAKDGAAPQGLVALPTAPGLHELILKPVSHRDVPAVSRAISVLRLLGASDIPLGVNAIATQLDAVPSTILHILRVLVREELVSFDRDSKRYALDAGILTIARQALRQSSFGHRVQNSLESLSLKYGVTTIAVRVIGMEHIVVVATANSNQMLQLHVEVGSRFPALMSATGRCVAAFQPYPWKEIQKKFQQVRWDKPPSLAQWTKEVEEAKQNRFSVDSGNYLAGVMVVAAPVLDRRERITHAIVALGLNEQTKPGVRTSLCNDVRAFAQRFSENHSL